MKEKRREGHKGRVTRCAVAAFNVRSCARLSSTKLAPAENRVSADSSARPDSRERRRSKVLKGRRAAGEW